MASVSQLKIQLGTDVTYRGGEPTTPPVPGPPPEPILVISEGHIPDGTDFGDIKVEGGKMKLDMDHFSPDYGTF